MTSIIIPIYNTENHLDKCLASISNQQFADFECILIDDGSTDNSPNICDEWAAKDNRFVVIHKKNAGVSAARNDGIGKAKGEHILFIDSDDWINDNYITEMFGHSIGADLTISGQIREYGNNVQKVFKPNKTETFSIIPENSATFTYLCKNWLLYAPHEKLYKRSIIERNHIRFQEGCSYGEDLLFNFEYLNHVDTISTIDDAYYHYRMGEESLSTRFRAKQFEEDYGQWKVLASFFQRKGLWNNDSKPYLYKRLWGIVYDGIFLYPQFNNNNVSSSYLKDILNIPEIESLKHHTEEFCCASWLKWLILHRQAFALKLMFYSKSIFHNTSNNK